MGQGILIWLITFLLAYFISGLMSRKFSKVKTSMLVILFLYHSLLAVAYYLYALFNPSDSKGYYRKVIENYRGEDWFNFFGTGTTFIEFIGYPFIRFFGFTYESTMVVFSFLGFLGFAFFYVFFKEGVKFKHRFLSVDLLTLIFFLPNIHFWTSSFGKGSVIFCGLGLFMFAIQKPAVRLWALLLGGWIIFQIRPHVFYVVLIATTISYSFSTKGVAALYRVIILAVSVFLLYYVYEDIIQLTGLDDESIFDSMISHRASDLSKATSGIDITNYSIPEKLFAFWFRPLFFDAPGFLGIIVSFENAFYLLFFLYSLRLSVVRFIWSSTAIVKTCVFTFLGVSFALAQISGNLGLAMRQKSQVMLLIFFMALSYMDQQYVHLHRVRARKKLRELRIISQKEKVS